METVTAYRAIDGQLFATEAQCHEHETSGVWLALLDKFVDSYGCAGYGNTKPIVLAWEAFKEKHKASTAPAAAVDIDEGPEIDVPVKRKLSASRRLMGLPTNRNRKRL